MNKHFDCIPVSIRGYLKVTQKTRLFDFNQIMRCLECALIIGCVQYSPNQSQKDHSYSHDQ